MGRVLSIFHNIIMKSVNIDKGEGGEGLEKMWMKVVC